MQHAGSVRIGRICVDRVSFEEALEAAEALCARGRGGFIVTPNVDHVVLAERDPLFAAAYDAASLTLADGKPIVWLSRAMGRAVPEKISGSDFVMPLVSRAAARGRTIFLLGGAHGVAHRAAQSMVRANARLRVAGVLAPPRGFENDDRENKAVLDAIRAAAPSLVLVALGAPRQELWMHRHHQRLAPAVLMGVGGTLDFIAGETRRAPRWMSDWGLEWLFRLAQEPRRLATRYLVRDLAFAGIAIRSLIDSRRDAPASAPLPPAFKDNARV